MLEDINSGTNRLPLTLSLFLIKETNLSKLDKLPNRILSPDRLNPASIILNNYYKAII